MSSLFGEDPSQRTRKAATMSSMNNPSVPVMENPGNTMMEAGPNGINLAAAAQARHPIDVMQRNPNRYQDLEFVRHVYGSGLAMHLATEQRMAAQHALVPGRRSLRPTAASMISEIYSGRDTRLDFEDVLGKPENRPELPRPNLHLAMERQLGL